MAFPTVYAGQLLTAGLIAQMAPVNVSATLRRYNGQSIPDSTSTAVTWHDELEDSAGGHDNVTNNSRWYAPRDGRYILLPGLTWANNATGRRAYFFKVNGATNYNGDSRTAGAATNVINSGGRTLRLAAGEYLEVFAFQTSGGGLNIDGATNDGCFLTIDYVGP